MQISTDEVYGSLGPEGHFREDTPINPTNPYSATKAAADLIVLSHAKTHRFPAVVTRCSNNYGPYQFPEKFIPLMITNAMEEVPIPVYGEGLNRREWIYVDDHSRGVWEAITRGRDGEVYNIGGGEEVANIDLVRQVLGIMGRSESLIQFVTDRPAHDQRYSIDCSKIQSEWGWSCTDRFPVWNCGYDRLVSIASELGPGGQGRVLSHLLRHPLYEPRSDLCSRQGVSMALLRPRDRPFHECFRSDRHF